LWWSWREGETGVGADVLAIQLLLWSETRYYSQGTIIADSREEAKGLFVITSGQV
jgi:hypothetical protein